MGNGREIAGIRSDLDPLAGNLRQMRASQAISQLELALRLGVSQRHVSFVELGRARPSRNLILSWARETGAPLDACNAALVSAGFAPALVELDTREVRGSPGFKALSEMIVAHDPYPGIVFDANWKICAMNEGGQWLCTVAMPGFLADLEGPVTELDMIAALAHPEGLLSRARNAAAVGYALLDQLRAEQLTRATLGDRVDRLERSLHARYGPPGAEGRRAAGEPYLNLAIDTALGTLSFLLVQTLFGLPQNVTHASLRSELWFPIDASSREVMRARAAARPPAAR